MNERGLSLSRDKSVCLIMGSKKQRASASLELKQSPLMCGSFETQEKQQDKWLGQTISIEGLADRVSKTIASKESKIRGACLEIAVIVNDWRAKVAGGMETATMLWEVCCIPILMHGAGTWV